VELLVRARNIAALRERIEAVGGYHVDAALHVGMTRQRLSQLLAGSATAVPIGQAARLEDYLRVPRGTFFAIEGDARLVRAYLRRPRAA
jgi:hypothetical protein